jgi:gas vesicle protein
LKSVIATATNIALIRTIKINVMRKTTEILTALVAGAAAGAVVGILFAPRKGTKTRRKISQEGQRIANDVTEKIHRSTEKLRDMKDGIELTLREAIDEFA